MPYLPSIDDFVKYLKDQKGCCKKLAYLKLTGCLEDYVVKEYIYFLKKHNLDAVFNFSGKNLDKDNRLEYAKPLNKYRVDICVFNPDDNQEISGFIEAKFFSNCIKGYDKAGGNFMPKKQKDMIRELRGKLSKLKEMAGKRWRNYMVDKNPYLGALIIYSYVSKISLNNGEKFVNELKQAGKDKFRNREMRHLYKKKDGLYRRKVEFLKKDGSSEFFVGDLGIDNLRKALKNNTLAKANKIVLQELGLSIDEVNTISKGALLQVFNKILKMRDFHSKIGVDRYKSFIPNEIQQLLNKAQIPKYSLDDKDYARLNKALLEAVYSLKSRKTQKYFYVDFRIGLWALKR